MQALTNEFQLYSRVHVSSSCISVEWNIQTSKKENVLFHKKMSADLPINFPHLNLIVKDDYDDEIALLIG